MKKSNESLIDEPCNIHAANFYPQAHSSKIIQPPEIPLH